MTQEKTILNSNDLDGMIKEIQERFSSLAAGKSLEIQCSIDPKPALEYFIEHLWGQFEWEPLERGGNVFRFVVRKFTNPNPERTIKDFMKNDHVRCDNLYAEMESAAFEENTEQMQQSFGAFEVAMTRHFDMEEKVLFPELEAKGILPMQMGPLAVMRSEHDQMRGVLRQMVDAAKSGDNSALTNLGETFIILIQQHNTKEEDIVYSMSESGLGTGQTEMIKKMILQ